MSLQSWSLWEESGAAEDSPLLSEWRGQTSFCCTFLSSSSAELQTHNSGIWSYTVGPCHCGNDVCLIVRSNRKITNAESTGCVISVASWSFYSILSFSDANWPCINQITANNLTYELGAFGALEGGTPAFSCFACLLTRGRSSAFILFITASLVSKANELWQHDCGL